jgi:YidC/Oxa1 family membrane protein insertase
LSLELSLHPHGKLILYIKDILQSILIFSIPLVIPLPAGIFCYWIPSGMFSISQTLLLRNPAFRKFLKLPLPVKPPDLKSPQIS